MPAPYRMAGLPLQVQQAKHSQLSGVRARRLLAGPDPERYQPARDAALRPTCAPEVVFQEPLVLPVVAFRVLALSVLPGVAARTCRAGRRKRGCDSSPPRTASVNRTLTSRHVLPLPRRSGRG